MANSPTTEKVIPYGLLVMTAVTGLVDAVSFLSLGHVFTRGGFHGKGLVVLPSAWREFLQKSANNERGKNFPLLQSRESASRKHGHEPSGL
jgi:hypothetical protein